MPTTRGAAKDPKDPQDFSGGASESSNPADAEIDGPYDDGNGNFEGHTEDGVDGTMVAVKTMDDSLAKMAAMQATVDLMRTSQARRVYEMHENQEKMNGLMRTSQARRDDEMRENQEKMNKNFETLLASLMPSDTPHPGTPSKPPPPAPDQQSPTGAEEAIDEDDD